MRLGLGRLGLLLPLALASGGVVLASAHVVMLPPGPIKERHDLMDVTVGDAAKTINQALKQGRIAEIPKHARAIAGVMDRFVTLFPPGSTDPDSRAKPEIWRDKTEFDALAMQLEGRATALAEAAESGGDVEAASQSMVEVCKACHDKFRVPDGDSD